MDAVVAVIAVLVVMPDVRNAVGVEIIVIAFRCGIDNGIISACCDVDKVGRVGGKRP